ncbi:SNG1 family protein [Kitasatospora sp. DSM 101779]|uniref:YhgE/Pip domain-containing protein n=1 Tax=Kitasatospora sp. DSM 101779 TaxID=2853165 RepID=UPI0021DB1702|nr:SNG1 family protein [Kitasatospora sp. DSM 101779]MCU7826551.1 SNG1 family protein [Kitasatospora sp. DSM 101779]
MTPPTPPGTAEPPAEPAAPPPSGKGATALQVLRNPRIWILPTVLTGVVALLLSLLYMGGILNPRIDLHRVPVGLVNADKGATVDGKQQNLGASITAAVAAAPDPDERVNWQVLSPDQAQEKLASNQLYGALLIPEDFTAAVAGLGQPPTGSPARPTAVVLTNPGSGSLASSFASSIATDAAHRASLDLGKQLTATAAQRASQQGTQVSNPSALLLADPITVETRVGHPIGPHSGLGLSAFYYTLLLVLAGFLGGNVIGNGVDVALGYTDNELGPWHTRRRTVPITRRRTWVVKSVMSVGISLLTSAVIMLATVSILGMDASHLPLLFVFSFCASAAVGLGVQAINATFGGIGQLVSMFVFIVLALPSSGATIPLQALPDFYRFLARFEPMRQLSDGIRAILYFDARADAGLSRAWIMIGVGTVLALLLGWAMTSYYDRKGLTRLAAEASA